jgi:DNA-binding NarL/FixJ family response regulator
MSPSPKSSSDADGLPAKRILILDDHPIMRLGLTQLIAAEPGLEVCDQAGSTAEALESIRDSRPDLLLTDLSLPDKHGLEFIKDMQALFPDCSILVLSMHDEALYAERVLRAGARGYLMKKSAAEHLIQAIQRVLAGGIYLSETMAAAMLELIRPQRRDPAGTSPIERLTDRELEVFQLIGSGKNSRQIAELLHISIRTVDAHRAHLKDKLQLGDGNALVHHAVSWVAARG